MMQRNEVEGTYFMLDSLETIKKKQNYNEINIQLPLHNRSQRKSMARDSIDTVSIMIEKKLRSNISSKRNSS